MMSIVQLPDLLRRAVDARTDLLDERHESALRLFNGFYEGAPDLVIDLYARTLVIHNYANEPRDAITAVQCAQDTLCEMFPWLRAVVVKTRHSGDSNRRGTLTFGDAPDTRIREHGVLYSIDLLMNRDASFYLDTRNLRRWLMDHMAGKTVLNTFAYTGSLGVAAVAGHAQRVVHLDLNRAFLNVAKTTYSLNGFPISKGDFINGDFFPMIGAMKRAEARFDCAVVDPPFFSQTSKGKIDLENESQRVINKVRPLINDGGYLITINNALFTSGADYMRLLNDLCADGYLSIAELITVPPDITGYPHTLVGVPPVDPAPFNHPTKIAILSVRRKAS
jgi:23S rRNA (cytosine1962-C5)-methyltransferase